MGNVLDNPEPLILAIDTATRAGSVALARAGEVLALQSGDATASHSIDLIANVDACLKDIGAQLNDVDLFAAAAGPGSFTGLRIGLATIKSFAMSVGRFCAGVPTLAAVAHAAGPSGQIIALLPAGRGEVFAQLFLANKQNVQPLDSAKHIRPETVLEKYGQIESLTWAGEGAHLNVEALRAGAEARNITFTVRAGSGLKSLMPGHQNNAEWTIAPQRVGLAIAIAALALDEYKHGRTISAEELRAIYVRPSDAEINERWQREQSQTIAPLRES